MASTGFGPVIQFPTPTIRPWGLLLPTIRRVDFGQRFPLGVSFQPFDFSALLFNDSDCAPANLPDTPRDWTTVVEQPAFSVWDAVTCSSLWKTPEELQEDVSARWPLLISDAFATELVNGTASGGHDLIDSAVDLGATTSVIAAVAEAEEALAINLRGSQGILHMAPSLLAHAVTNGTVHLNGGNYFSPGGHLVVADSGYQGTETTTSTMWVTGPVYYDITEREALSGLFHENFDFTRNIAKALEMAYGILIFDPGTVWKTLVTK